jgi:hypothetical protein
MTGIEKRRLIIVVQAGPNFSCMNSRCQKCEVERDMFTLHVYAMDLDQVGLELVVCIPAGARLEVFRLETTTDNEE